MKKLRRRIFAAVLAALMMITAMPATVLYASAETVSDNAIEQAGTEDTEETVDGDTEETETDGAGETVDGDTEEPAQEPPTGPLEEDTARCICETLCTEDGINGDCPVCGAEGADLSACKGKEQGSVPETDTEDDNAETDTAKCICEILCTEDSINGDCPVCGADDASLLDCKGKVPEENMGEQEDTGICKHHQEHDADCGYIPKSEDGEGSPCTYECRICPIEALIAALPDTVTEDNRADVCGQLDEILALYRELNEDEQGQIDLASCYELQGALDAANVPMTAEIIEGKVKTYNGSEETTSFTAGDTIKVVAALAPAGEAPADSTMFAASFIEPGAGQMAVFVGDTQVSEPVDAVDGTYTMEVSAADVLLAAGGPGTEIPLTAKFIGNTSMADGTGTATVNITAAAKAERGGTLLGYYDASGLDAALANSGNAGATFTLLANVERTTALIIKVSCTLDLNGKTIHSTGQYESALGISSGATVTIRGDGTVTSEHGNGLSVSGTATLEGGNFISGAADYGGVNVRGKLIVTGENVVVRNTGNGNGLSVNSGTGATAQLSAGTYGGGAAAIEIYQGTGTLAGLLNQEGASRVAYYKDNTTLVTEGLDGKTLPGGSYTVKACTHTGEGVCTYAHNENTSTHTKTCLACGYTETGDCGFEKTADPTADSHTGQCPDCKRDRSDAHSFSDWAGNPVARTCTVCGYEQTAAARVEKDSTTTYVGALANAFTEGNSGATVTLLTEVDLGSKYIGIRGSSTFTLDLNGQTVKASHYGAFYISGGSLTIQDSGTGGKIESSNITIEVTGGTLSIKSGTVSGYYGVQITRGTVNISGGTISGTENGLCVNGGGNIALSGGAYSGRHAIWVDGNASVTMKDMLAPGYAYHQNDIPIAKAKGLVGDEVGEVPLDAKPAWLTGTVTVKACTHTGEGVCAYVHNENTSTHTETCLACGNAKDAETCSYDATTGRCVCGSTLAVTLPADLKLTYDGTAKEPAVTVTLDGTKLTETDYGVTYTDNINAGTDTATVTVTGKGNYSFEIEKTFSIEKAEQKDFAVVSVIMQYEKNGTFTLPTTGGGGDGAVLYRVPENNGVLMVNGDQATIIGVGTVTVTVTKAESGNYKAAMATGTVTITKATAPVITYPTAGSITYGQKLSDSALTGGSVEYGTFAWENGSTIPAVDNTGYTVVFTASEETKKNYETITDTAQNVPVKVEKAVPAVSVTAAVSGSKDNRQAVITVNVAEAGAGAFPTGKVTFIDCTGGTETEIGTATLTGGSATCTWEGLQDKEYTVRAVYAGNNNYTEAESRELTFDAAKQDQQGFALDEIGAKTYGDAAVPLKTTGGNGSGAVRYESSDENVIRIEDGRAVIVGAGTATITAIKAGDDRYNEASASRNVTVAKKALTVRADSITVVRGDTMPPFTYKAPELVNGDTFTADPSMTAGVQDTDILGKYDIVISGGTLRNSESYNITYVNGILNIVERFYTVTVTDGTGSGEYAEGDTVTVTADERNGYTFTGWSSGDGVTFADSTAKTTTFTMPAKAVAVKANYTRNSSGGNTGGGGGNSGGNENNGGTGGGDSGNGNNGGNGSTNPGNGNTTPQPSVTQPTDTNASPGNGANPGTGTTPVNPGNGNTSRPGAGSGSGAGTPAQGTKQPFIKGEDGKIGWDVIRAEEEQAQEGSTINVDMNGSVVVPGDIFDSIKGKDITITFDMGNGITWSVNGKSITADKAGDIDFSVKTGVNTVPVDIVNNVTGESYSIQLSLAYEGDFGFTAVLSIGLGKENAGYTASLYYYNESTGELEFICSDEVAQDGTVSLAFTHASDYVIAIDGKQEGGDGAAESAQPDGKDGTAGNGTAMEKPSQEGQQWRLWWLIVAGVLVLAMGAGVFFIRKKKSDED